MKNTADISKSLLAAAYARYSTALQTETSIAAQLAAIEKYCDANHIQLYGKCYIDEACSGTNTDRDGFQALLSDARRGLFNAVVVYDVSRGSRDVADWFAFRRQMSELGIKVLSVTNTLGDPDDPDSYLIELITVGIGQHQVLQSRQKSIAGKRLSASRGLFCGGYPPFGYRIENRQYVINDLEAPYVVMIFDMYAHGASYREILAALDEKGVVGRRGKSFTPTGIKDMLNNERYTGKYIWFEKEMRHMKKYVGRPGTDPVKIEGAIPRIISDELWATVRARKAANLYNRENKCKPGREYLLSGLVYCEECGSAMIGITTISKGHEYKRYRCQGKARHRTCTMKDISGDRLEERAYELIRGKILNDEAIEKIADMVMDYLTPTKDEHSAILSELNSINAKLDNLLQAVESGLASNVIVERVNALSKRKKELQAKYADCSRLVLPSRESILEVLRSDMEQLSNASQNLKPLYKEYINAIIVGRDAVEYQLSPFGPFESIKKHAYNDNRCKHETLLR
jgi:site-specific DNA recombinase